MKRRFVRRKKNNNKQKINLPVPNSIFEKITSPKSASRRGYE